MTFPYPITVPFSKSGWEWGNALSFKELIVEPQLSICNDGEPINDAQELFEIVRDLRQSCIVNIRVAEEELCAIVCKSTFVAHKQCIDVESRKSFLTSSAFAYTNFYESGPFHDNAVPGFRSEQAEVMNQLNTFLSSCEQGGKSPSEKSIAESKGIPVISTYSWSGNIQHLIVEGLTRLTLFDEFVSSNKVVCTNMLLDYFIPSNQLAIDLARALYGTNRVCDRKPSDVSYHEKAIILVPQQINFRSLLKSSAYALATIKQRLDQTSHSTEGISESQTALGTLTKNSETVFLCRMPDSKNTTSRCIDNLEECREALERKGVTIVHPESLSLKDRLDSLKGYRNVILEDGASLMNLLFTNPKQVFVLSHPLFKHNREFFKNFFNSLFADTSRDICWIEDSLLFDISIDELWSQQDRFSRRYKLSMSALLPLIS